MRIFGITILVLILSAICQAQGSAVRSASQGGGQNISAATVANLPVGKVAIIDSRYFPDGIAEYKQKLDKLEAEFKPQTNAINALAETIKKLEDELKQAGANLDPKVYQQKLDDLAAKKKEFERKREDYQQDLQKRSEVVLGPVQEKIAKFLEQYAIQNNITAIFDLVPASQGGMVFFSPTINITDDFIKEYNKQNPVPSAPPQP
ncbi:MAG: OmpH family outer membrane protein [Acidobacteriota bacterium]|nr:OmpH family outer membrane protein [Blastocatellia bacterium]MDW8412126.1 OmpH family outer membrane protein [Acidobacteriota bacterium]